MILHITEPYLWLPVNKKNPEVKLHFYCGQTKFQEIDIQLGGTDGDFYTSMDVSRYLGRDIEIRAGEKIPEESLYSIFCHSERTQNVYPFRPQLHFAPEFGWHNDPNGLVFADGVYHLYYQWNPYGVIWGNMHWGHAVSKDLIRWEHRPGVMDPDQYGTVYSGCGFQDKDNAAGFGSNALLFFYTAAGGCNQWSIDTGGQHTQRLAVSTDGGETLRRTDHTILPHIAGTNRDPKVFYHRESGAYIMVLYLEGFEFAIFRSADLLHWEETQRLSADGMQECPDLFELSTDQPASKKKWVLWSANGYYQVGSFDGYHFTPESEVLSSYSTRLAYAAQTYAGVDDRTISVAWLRLDNDRGNYRGVMTIPAELSLVRDNDSYKMRFCLPKELLAYRQLSSTLAENERTFETTLCGKPIEVSLNWSAQETGSAQMRIGDTSIAIDFGSGSITFANPQVYAEPIAVSFDRSKSLDLDLDLVIDQEVIEFFGDSGVLYGAVETEENILRKKFTLASTAEIASLRLYEFVLL